MWAYQKWQWGTKKGLKRESRPESSQAWGMVSKWKLLRWKILLLFLDDNSRKLRIKRYRITKLGVVKLLKCRDILWKFLEKPLSFFFLHRTAFVACFIFFTFLWLSMNCLLILLTLSLIILVWSGWLFLTVILDSPSF